MKIDIEKLNFEDKINIDDKNLGLKHNVFLYVVEKDNNQNYKVIKKHNIVVNQGRFLMLQRLTGINDVSFQYADKEVKYFAAGDGAASAPCTTPVPETASDTDLINKLTPIGGTIVGTYYLDISPYVSYPSLNVVRFSFSIDDTIYPTGTRINEMGLYGSNSIDFVLFARVTFGDIIIEPGKLFLVDWWVMLVVNIA